MTQTELNNLAVELVQANGIPDGTKAIARLAIQNGLGVQGCLEACEFVVKTIKDAKECK